jgi:uncharacterized lipoprotein
MKKLLLLTLAVLPIIGCATNPTVRQAKLDFYNFKKTIQFNLQQPAVYKNSYY